MKKLSQKDHKNRILTQNSELKIFILKTIIKNLNFLYLTRWNASLKLSKISKCNHKTRLVNRCIITDRKQTINSKRYKISRIVFLKLARQGYLSGVKKSVW